MALGNIREFADISGMEQNVHQPPRSNVLYGTKAIAAYVFGDTKYAGRVIDLIRRHRPPYRFPIFKLGSTICARISEIDAWILARERADNDNAPSERVA